MRRASRVSLWLSVAVFFLAYGLIEDMIKKARPPKRPLDALKWIHLSPPARLQAEPERTPEVRGYDSCELFRQDTLIRLREIYRKVAQHNRNIEGILSEMRRPFLTSARASLIHGNHQS
jgi:hypothetical protein